MATTITGMNLRMSMGTKTVTGMTKKTIMGMTSMGMDTITRGALIRMHGWTSKTALSGWTRSPERLRRPIPKTRFCTGATQRPGKRG